MQAEETLPTSIKEKETQLIELLELLTTLPRLALGPSSKARSSRRHECCSRGRHGPCAADVGAADACQEAACCQGNECVRPTHIQSKTLEDAEGIVSGSRMRQRLQDHSGQVG
eukprot:1141242-Pelagomonas_calceolata.AAC.2